MSKIRVGVIGVGNCCSSLVQGIRYYKLNSTKTLGLMNPELGNYKISDIEIVSAFDVDRRKVGRTLDEAIYEEPNCTQSIGLVPAPKFLSNNTIVLKAPVLDGVSQHMKEYFQVDENCKEMQKDEIISVLKSTKTEILINYLPVGSQKATEFWANISLESNIAFINCIPIFIASNEYWAKRFRDKNVPILGDDIKSQVGATIVHRSLIKMLVDRGAKIDSTYQLNVGGNTDFRNMLDTQRLETKKISKTESVSSQIPYNTYVYAGPNGCIDFLNDNKVCHLRIDFRIFGNIPCSIDLKLSVEDSPNSAGVVIDAIRYAKLALDRNFNGVLPLSAYFFKHPPNIKLSDEESRILTEEFMTSTNK